jgi:[ribosomal protein S5]-alanine N-acetyltransferase
MEFKCYETERLYLRPTTVADAAFVLSLLNSEKWLQYIGDRNVKTVADACKYIEEKMLPQLYRTGFSNYTVIRKADDIKIGSCGLYDREGIDGVDIGFAFLPEYENMGYGFESARKILEMAKADFDIKIISAITTKDNLSSQKLIKRLGFKRNGIVVLPQAIERLLLYKIYL